jgi:hypothetical protein
MKQRYYMFFLSTFLFFSGCATNAIEKTNILLEKKYFGEDVGKSKITLIKEKERIGSEYDYHLNMLNNFSYYDKCILIAIKQNKNETFKGDFSDFAGYLNSFRKNNNSGTIDDFLEYLKNGALYSMSGGGFIDKWFDKIRKDFYFLYDKNDKKN